MQQQVKLVVGHSLDGQEQEFYIFENVVFGEGGFGVVKKAVSAKDKSKELAVKIVPYGGDPVKKSKIERQINILRILPQHPNLVKVYPIKCFSENNFYIFMEYCKDGTLGDLTKNTGFLQQDKILDIFWQLMSGYRVLWEKKIVHQDLKLANVLIKKNTFKITDFGFSILSQKWVPSLTREGTLHYMSLEKLTDPHFIADEKSDIYSLGVMMYEIMTKIHPYINQKGIKTQKEFVNILRGAQLTRPRVVNSFSAPMQGLYDLIVKMIAKSEKNRIDCHQIYAYIDNDQIFNKYRLKMEEKTQQVHLNPLPMTITAQTNVFVIPFPIQPENQGHYIHQIKQDQKIKKNQENRKIIEKFQQWMLSRRLLVYFFDRVARRLYVQKFKGHFANQKTHSYNRVILSCFLIESKITANALKQLRSPKFFTKDESLIFRTSQEGVRTQKIIQKDQSYIDQEITDNLKRTNQIQSKEQKDLMELARKDGFQLIVERVVPFFKDCILQKSNLISNRSDLITLIYLKDAINFLKQLPNPPKNFQLEQYFYKTETRQKISLFQQMEEYSAKEDIISNYDEEIYSLDPQIQKQEI